MLLYCNLGHIYIYISDGQKKKKERKLSQHINPPQNPLQMPIRQPRLKLWLHVPGQIRLGPHQSPLVMLHTHGPLRPVNAIIPIRIVHSLVL